MKASNRNQRSTKNGVTSAKHNDRNFNVEKTKDQHIDPSRCDKNVYILFQDGMEMGKEEGQTFEQWEKEKYTELYSDYIQIQNAKCKATHQSKDKYLTIDKLLASRKSAPEDTVLQIGNFKDGSVTGKTLMDVYETYTDKRKEAGLLDGVVLLDVALHMDEATPHIHERKTYTAKEEDHIIPHQNKCLEQMGLVLEGERSRHNNLKKDYTAVCRELWYESCREHGLDIDTTPSKSREHLETKEYKEMIAEAKIEVEAIKEQAVRERDNALKDLSMVRQEVSKAQEELHAVKEEIERQRGLLERIKDTVVLAYQEIKDRALDVYEWMEQGDWKRLMVSFYAQTKEPIERGDKAVEAYVKGQGTAEEIIEPAKAIKELTKQYDQEEYEYEFDL